MLQQCAGVPSAVGQGKARSLLIMLMQASHQSQHAAQQVF